MSEVETILDYIDQVARDGHGSDMCDWKVQTVIAKQMKNLAKKCEILLVSPYQVDDCTYRPGLPNYKS